MATNRLATALDLEVRPLTSVIGAEVSGIDLREPLDAATVARLSDALLQWKVLFFRDQRITQDQQIAFGRSLATSRPCT